LEVHSLFHKPLQPMLAHLVGSASPSPAANPNVDCGVQIEESWNQSKLYELPVILHSAFCILHLSRPVVK
jgi:hypothetical protein